MPPELPTALLTISRLDGSKKTWRVQLTPQTPFDPEALTAALVERFVGSEASARDFRLTVSGTAGAPIFTLEESAQLFGEATEIPS